MNTSVALVNSSWLLLTRSISYDVSTFTSCGRDDNEPCKARLSGVRFDKLAPALMHFYLKFSRSAPEGIGPQRDIIRSRFILYFPSCCHVGRFIEYKKPKSGVNGYAGEIFPQQVWSPMNNC